jgi:ABC-2 type transport system permease protein
MLTLLQVELYKIFKRPRSYIAFIAIAALIGINQLGLKLDGDAYVSFVMNNVEQSFVFQGNLLNGYLVCYIILQLLLVHVPLLIALVAADMVSGEANIGTLRLLFNQPVSRKEIILAKFLAAAIYTLLLLVWLAILALFVSLWLFGTDDLIIQKTRYLGQLSRNDVFWCYIGAFGFALLAMLTVAALGFLLSIFADNSIGAIVATFSIIIFLTILSTMSIPLFQKIQPYLFTTHMVAWKEFFDSKVNADNAAINGTIQNKQQIIQSAGILILHIVVFIGIAMNAFKRKDILT